PPVFVACERHVGALLEAELVDVELDRLVGVEHRHAHDADLGDLGLGLAHDCLLDLVSAPMTSTASRSHRALTYSYMGIRFSPWHGQRRPQMRSTRWPSPGGGRSSMSSPAAN